MPLDFLFIYFDSKNELHEYTNFLATEVLKNWYKPKQYPSKHIDFFCFVLFFSKIPRAMICSVCWFSFMPNYSLRPGFSLSPHICTFELLGQGATLHFNLLFFFVILWLFNRTFFWYVKLPPIIWKYLPKSWVIVFPSETQVPV